MVEFSKEEVNGPVVRGYGPAGFKVGNRRVPGGLLLLPDDARDWNAPDSARALTLAHFDDALAMQPAPEFVLLGTGTALIQPDPAIARELADRDVGLEVMDSGAAARAWSILRAEERWIAALLMPVTA